MVIPLSACLSRSCSNILFRSCVSSKLYNAHLFSSVSPSPCISVLRRPGNHSSSTESIWSTTWPNNTWPTEMAEFFVCQILGFRKMTSHRLPQELFRFEEMVMYNHSQVPPIAYSNRLGQYWCQTCDILLNIIIHNQCNWRTECCGQDTVYKDWERQCWNYLKQWQRNFGCRCGVPDNILVHWMHLVPKVGSHSTDFWGLTKKSLMISYLYHHFKQRVVVSVWKSCLWKEFSLVVLQTILNGSPLERYCTESTMYTNYRRSFYKFAFLARCSRSSSCV